MDWRQPHKTLSGMSWLRGGGLFVLLSLGLHWVVLQIPIADSSLPPVILSEAAPEEPAETIDIVRLSEVPREAPAPKPAPVTPPAAVPQPATAAQAVGPVRSPQPRLDSTPSSQPAPAPELTPEPKLTPEPIPSPNPPLVPEAISPMTLDERLQTLAEYNPNNRAKSLNASTLEFLDWYGSQTWDGLDSLPLPGPKALAPLSVAYPLDRCLTPPPSPGQLETIINPDGSLVREPRVVGSTGYDVLDEKAVELATRYEFPAEGSEDAPNPTVYWLPVEVVYDASTCTP